MLFSFFLRKDKDRNRKGRPVKIRVLLRQGKFKYAKTLPKIECLPEDWDSQKKQIKPSKGGSYNFYAEYNLVIKDYELRLTKLQQHLISHSLTISKTLVDRALNSENLILSFFQVFHEFIASNQNLKATRTISSYTTSLNFLKKFERHNGPITFSSIDLIWYDELQQYAFQLLELNSNYFAKIVSVFKNFMTWSKDRNYHNNTAYLKFKQSETPTPVVFLSFKELMALYNFEYQSKRLIQVRDLYCFAAFTGLRFSDLKALRAENVNADHLRITIHKTRDELIIPLNQYAKLILDSYKETIHTPLPKISSQKFNHYIKECCEYAGINDPTSVTRYSGAKSITTTSPKYELITSHTARKTFVTNSILLGMNTEVIKKITGHKKDSTFKKYFDLVDQELLLAMKNSWDATKK